MLRFFKRAFYRARSVSTRQVESVSSRDAGNQSRLITSKTQPLIKPRSEHPISRRNIDSDALKVLYRLKNHGFIAYLVGGSVRDLMMGRLPKDFDVGTDARPNQIRKLFRNCFLVGRRFRLAHIKFGSKVIETSTFRRTPYPTPVADPHHDLLQRHDNTFGTPEEDARRRDFTINGLFYDIATFSVIDHVGGLNDLERRIIRCIGDPDIRFREDPVRMIRAIRFAARLEFTIEPVTWSAIVRHASEILKASPSRLLEEIHRLFAFRSGERAFRLLVESGLVRFIFPEIHSHLEARKSDSPLWRCLRALDNIEANSEAPQPAIIWGTLILPLVGDRISDSLANGTSWDSVQTILMPMVIRYHVPKHVTRFVCGAIPSFRFLVDRPATSRTRQMHFERIARSRDFGNVIKLAMIAASAGLLPHPPISDWNALYLRTLGQTNIHRHHRR